MSIEKFPDRVVITLDREQFDLLLMTLGFAAGRACAERRRDFATAIIALTNAVNEGNPDWTPIWG
jgi:hypothetical protein